MSAPQPLPIIFLIHPVGIGATRAMNVLSAKLWLRALVDHLPAVAIAAPWLPYAEAMIEQERGLRDALVFAGCCQGAVAVGGDFNQGTHTEWELFGRLDRPRINLTRPPMPGLLTYETFAETRTPAFQQIVTRAFFTVTVPAHGAKNTRNADLH
jgi:hypothetical protein